MASWRGNFGRPTNRSKPPGFFVFCLNPISSVQRCFIFGFEHLVVRGRHGGMQTGRCVFLLSFILNQFECSQFLSDKPHYSLCYISLKLFITVDAHLIERDGGQTNLVGSFQFSIQGVLKKVIWRKICMRGGFCHRSNLFK